MDEFKIKHFEGENPDKQFPHFRRLGKGEMDSMRETLSTKLSVSDDALAIVREIENRGIFVKEFNASDPKFALTTVLSTCRIEPKDNVFINWYRYDDIDEMSLADLDKYFRYIWYAGPDDLDIFDSTLNWILSISHEGFVRVLQI